MLQDSDQTKTLRVAIIGVGLAGAALASFLKSVPDVEVQLYERSKTHRKVGAWLGLTPTAQNLLEQICGEESVEAISDCTYGKPVKRHWKTGEVLFQPEPIPDSLSREEKKKVRATANTVRQDLHQILLDRVPEEQIHMGKKAIDFLVHDGQVTVLFEDNSSIEVDLLIASDGINSKLRAKVYPQIKPKHLPTLEYIETFDRAELMKTIPDLPTGVTHFINGDTLAFIGDVGCNRLGVILCLPADPREAENWGWAEGAGTRRLEYLRSVYKDWNPLILHILEHSKDMGVFPISRGVWLDSLVTQGCVCFVGDSAHPTGAALGAGCSFAFEDSQTLSLALKHAYAKARSWSPSTVSTALNLYDTARASHLRKIFKLLEREDMNFNGILKDEAMLEEERKEKAKGTAWLTNFDPESEFAAVLGCEIVNEG
ncbi:FAD/NAD(P)-binding domain-containing protein [Myriangium duriaei CBS 260.36]|uniref:FAD/NAD(P)-binding domain-containing protein n=1 Tax=Myriangium duriaei CBS 260.36 TaxID=1168546 RepID=A0A9P4JDC1_9PEZI|nr:FAD/NAD(P)-binding domain-containing protein [Myriangium duriaei CBS 260.36]